MITDTINDNATNPIIAIDFDGTFYYKDDTYHYPECGRPRAYMKQVLDQFKELGVKVVIWTCRQDDESVTKMTEWLESHKMHYDSTNSSIKFAPYHYESRKIYAHMYVDDMAYGWIETETIMISVFNQFCRKFVNITVSELTERMKQIHTDYKDSIPQTKEQLGEDLCNYCDWTDRGRLNNQVYCVGGMPHMCEGSYCDDAYENYLDDFEGVE